MKRRIIISEKDIEETAQLLLTGQILLLKIGNTFGLFFNPAIDGLDRKLNILKGRTNNQHFSLICNYTQATKLIDESRINEDFYNIAECLSSIALLRIPLNTSQPLPFPYNQSENTVQYFSFMEAHPLLRALQIELERKGCEYFSCTSGNIHGEPSCRTLDEALILVERLNARVRELDMFDIQVIVVDIPSLESEYKGSLPIVSFLNRRQVEVIRYIENDLLATKVLIEKAITGKKIETTVKYIA